MDNIVLAAAGVVRLGWQERITQFFDPLTVLSAPGQGSIAVGLTDARTCGRRLPPSTTGPPSSRRGPGAASPALLGGGCQTPIASFATVEDGAMRLAGSVISLDGTELYVRVKQATIPGRWASAPRAAPSMQGRMPSCAPPSAPTGY